MVILLTDGNQEKQIWWLTRKRMCSVLDIENEESIVHLGGTEILFSVYKCVLGSNFKTRLFKP